jgi:hypothetical protein
MQDLYFKNVNQAYEEENAVQKDPGILERGGRGF